MTYIAHVELSPPEIRESRRSPDPVRPHRIAPQVGASQRPPFLQKHTNHLF
jgi:hypothetical protein